MDVEMVCMDSKEMESHLYLKHSLKKLQMLKKLVAQCIQLGI